MAQSEQQQFLEEVEKDGALDQLDAPLVPETGKTGEGEEPAKKEDSSEEVEESLKNRRHRRLEGQLRAEREANIAMAERLRLISESKETRESDASYLKEAERIYGNETPEAREATNLLKAALENVHKTASEDALRRFREEQAQAAKAVEAEDVNLDEMIENLEEEHGVALTKEQRTGYFKMLERMSPKDADGNVTAYADPDAVWEEYQTKLQSSKKTDNKAKNLAARSMTQSGASVDSNLGTDSTLRFLRDNGIVD